MRRSQVPDLRFQTGADGAATVRERRRAHFGLRLSQERRRSLTVAALMRGAAAAALAALMAAAAVRTALAWSDRTHVIITEEAIARLPEPLRGLFAEEAALKRLQEAAVAPDSRRKQMEKDAAAAPPERREALKKKADEEKFKHYLDIDAITPEPPPFKNFPRDRQAAEKLFGAKAFQEHGIVPWAAEQALNDLADALARGQTERIFRAAGDLAHYAADLHTPMHVSKNFNGQLTGNDGIHKALEVGLYVRNEEFYAAEVRKNRREVAYLESPRDSLFEWLIQANGRMAPIIEADTAARRKTAYNPGAKTPDAEKEMEDPANEKSRPYYAALAAELEARGSPEASAMRDAAAHLADLLYTAWVRAGKPASLTPAAPAPVSESAHLSPYLLLIPAALLLLLVLWPRRKPQQ